MTVLPFEFFVSERCVVRGLQKLSNDPARRMAMVKLTGNVVQRDAYTDFDNNLGAGEVSFWFDGAPEIFLASGAVGLLHKHGDEFHADIDGSQIIQEGIGELLSMNVRSLLLSIDRPLREIQGPNTAKVLGLVIKAI